MFFEKLIGSRILENLAWTIVNSIWQIAFVSIVLFILLKRINKSNANLRYITSVSALILAVLLPISTFLYLQQTPNKTAQQLYHYKNNVVLMKTNRPANNSNNVVSYWTNNLAHSFKTNAIEFSHALISLWLLGLMLFTIRFFGGLWQVNRYKTKGISPPNKRWQESFSKLSSTLQIKDPIRFFQSELVNTPMVIGWLKPVILIPTSLFLQMDAKQLETVIAHEIQHIRRLDYLINTAQSLVEVMFFYHPCIWWISSIIRHERECACDQSVIRSVQNHDLTYAKALVAIAELRITPKQTSSWIATAANGGNLFERISRIINKETISINKFQYFSMSAGLIFVFTLTFAISLFWVSPLSDRDRRASPTFKNSNMYPPPPKPPAPLQPPKPPMPPNP